MLNFLSRLFSRPSSPSTESSLLESADAKWLVVGLGNPGSKYSATRHNVGYMALDMLIDERGKSLAAVSGVKAQAAAADEVVYARTTTYMNLSGEGIAPLARELGISPENIIVLHDELDLPAGQVRIKRGGNENGHNGLKSLTEHLGTREYIRVRMGIGRPTDGQPVPDWVLGPVEGGKQLEDQLHLAAEAVDLIVSEGLEKAQNKVHSKR